jgi:hypothetical protein
MTSMLVICFYKKFGCCYSAEVESVDTAEPSVTSPSGAIVTSGASKASTT